MSEPLARLLLLLAHAPALVAGIGHSTLKVGNGKCAGWCSPSTCRGINKHTNRPMTDDCGGCAACHDPKNLIACAEWCNEWTCDQPDQCGECPRCMPRPPPPPMAPNRFLHNPFASSSGWYVNPTLRSNLQTTLAEAAPAEKAVLEKMLEVPSRAALWCTPTPCTSHEVHC